jgi:hypothetical protein
MLIYTGCLKDSIRVGAVRLYWTSYTKHPTSDNSLLFAKATHHVSYYVSLLLPYPLLALRFDPNRAGYSEWITSAFDSWRSLG